MQMGPLGEESQLYLLMKKYFELSYEREQARTKFEDISKSISNVRYEINRILDKEKKESKKGSLIGD